MKRTTALRQLQVSASGEGLVSRGGIALLAGTARVAGIEDELRTALASYLSRDSPDGISAVGDACSWIFARLADRRATDR